MHRYAVPAAISAFIFDVDRTLYDNDEYADLQIQTQYRRAADYWGTDPEQAASRVRAWRADYARGHGGAHQSLGNTLAALGIPISTSVRWRSEDIHPEDHLRRDPHLQHAVAHLARTRRLVALTNNPERVGIATLEVLGVRTYFHDVVGLDTTGRSKPDPEPFREALRRLGAPTVETVSIGDRYDVDIAPALDLGMGGVLVSGVAEVYQLPRMLTRPLD